MKILNAKQAGICWRCVHIIRFNNRDNYYVCGANYHNIFGTKFASKNCPSIMTEAGTDIEELKDENTGR